VRTGKTSGGRPPIDIGRGGTGPTKHTTKPTKKLGPRDIARGGPGAGGVHPVDIGRGGTGPIGSGGRNPMVDIGRGGRGGPKVHHHPADIGRGGHGPATKKTSAAREQFIKSVKARFEKFSFSRSIDTDLIPSKALAALKASLPGDLDVTQFYRVKVGEKYAYASVTDDAKGENMIVVDASGKHVARGRFSLGREGGHSKIAWS
jgi:hypothetical protein